MDSGGTVIVPNLARQMGLTLLLLDDTQRWRQRLVETLDFRSTDRVEVTSSYQLELSPSLLAPFVGTPVPPVVRVLLPLTTRPKQPLLGLHLAGPGGAPVNVHRRRSIAAVEAEYIDQVLRTSAVAKLVRPGLPPELVLAMCRATTARLQAYVDQAGDEVLGTTRFLRDELGVGVGVDDVHRWQDALAPAVEVLTTAIEEGPDPRSTSENLLLTLVELPDPPRHVSEIDQVVSAYAGAICHSARDPDLATVLAEYGRRWEMLVELDAPTDAPFTVKVGEHRRLAVGRMGWCVERVNVGDAQSAHVQATVHDPAVRIAGFRVHTPTGRQLVRADFEGVRTTQESVALFMAELQRPYYLDLSLQLRPRPDVTVILWGLFALTAAGAVMAADRDLTGKLGLLAVPTSFAVAVLLLRERTALADRLQRVARSALLLAFAGLWLVVLARTRG